MLTLFILTCLCSFVFNNQLELKSESLANNLLTTAVSQKRRNSTLRSGESLHSKNGKFVLTLNECRITLKNINDGKILHQSEKVTNVKGCRAVLRRNSNFEIVSNKNTVVWSTRTAVGQKGKGPFRLNINSKGNLIVRNKKRVCVWALFGCPVSKAFIGKINRMKPSKAAVLLQTRMKNLKKKLNGLPITQLPLAKGKPKIKNQLPKAFSKTKPKKFKPTTLLASNKINRVKDIINEGQVSSSDWGRIRGIIGKAVKGNQLKKLGQLVKSGNFSYGDIKRKALEKISKGVQNIQKGERKKEPKKTPTVQTKSDLRKNISKQPWMKNVKSAVKSGVKFTAIKTMLKTMGNVKGNTSYWANIKKAIKQKNVTKIIRLVSLPVRQVFVWRRPVYYPPAKRWVLRYRSYITWSWRYYYTRFWTTHCWGWWWWRRCYWCLHSGGWYWYRNYYWTGYYYWSYE